MLPERGDQHEGSRTRTCKNMRSRNDDEHQEEEEEEEEPDRLGELREERLRPCFSWGAELCGGFLFFAARRSAWSPPPPGAPEAKATHFTVVHRREKKNKTTSDS